MFAFDESLKRQAMKFISPNTKIRLLSIKVSAAISDNMPHTAMYNVNPISNSKCHPWAGCLIITLGRHFIMLYII